MPRENILYQVKGIVRQNIKPLRASTSHKQISTIIQNSIKMSSATGIYLLVEQQDHGKTVSEQVYLKGMFSKETLDSIVGGTIEYTKTLVPSSNGKREYDYQAIVTTMSGKVIDLYKK